MNANSENFEARKSVMPAEAGIQRGGEGRRHKNLDSRFRRKDEKGKSIFDRRYEISRLRPDGCLILRSSFLWDFDNWLSDFD
jgi:hypothetical protein